MFFPLERVRAVIKRYILYVLKGVSKETMFLIVIILDVLQCENRAVYVKLCQLPIKYE